jgi:hypothetical protein
MRTLLEEKRRGERLRENNTKGTEILIGIKGTEILIGIKGTEIICRAPCPVHRQNAECAPETSARQDRAAFQ